MWLSEWMKTYRDDLLRLTTTRRVHRQLSPPSFPVLKVLLSIMGLLSSMTLMWTASLLARSPTGKRNPAKQEMHSSLRQMEVAQVLFGKFSIRRISKRSWLLRPTDGESGGSAFHCQLTSRENARKNLESILPQLKSRWAEWKSRFNRRDEKIGR